MPHSVEEEIRELSSLFWSERDPEGRAFAPLADAHRRLGELSKALELVGEGLGRHAEFAPGHVVAGWVRRDRGETDAATEAFQAALALDAENAEALRGLEELAEAAAAEVVAAEVVAEEPAASGADAAASELEPIVGEAAGEAVEDGPVTRTMAELYARQGLHLRALRVYQQLLERDPHDEGLRELVAKLETGPGTVPARSPDAEVETLARDWAEGAGHVGEISTPFAWTPGGAANSGEQSERQPGRSVSEYFRGLLEWEPAVPGPEESGGATPAPAAETASPSESVGGEERAEPVAVQEPAEVGVAEELADPVDVAEPAETVAAFEPPLTAPPEPEAAPVPAPEPDAEPAPEETASLAPEHAASIDSLAPESIVSIDSLAPEPEAALLAPAAQPPDAAVDPGPGEVVPIGSLAPEVVEIASLAPDQSGPARDEFSSWLQRLR